MEISNLQFNFTGDAESFKKASEEVKKRLKEQDIEVKKSEKSFITFNKVVLASGVGLGVLAAKNLPKVKAGFTAFAKSGGSVLTSLEKIALATKGVFGPFAKMGTAITGLTLGFETADFAMSAMGVSTAGVVGSFVSMGGVLSGVLAVGLTGFISLLQSASDTLGNSLLAKSREWLEVGADLETQTFALNTSLKQYRDATGDASVTTASMVDLLDDLGQTTGLTRQQLKGGLTTMLNLSRVTGLTSEQIKVLIKRSADMSVALGADFNEVVLAIDQSFKGYNERLLNFGVNITQATLAQTKFVSSQDRTVDSLSSAQLVVAKFEDILDQTKNTGDSLARANQTLQGSALTLELAYQSLQNRMGEATQEAFGPAIVAFNNMRTSIINLAGSGGFASLSAVAVTFGGVLFKGIAFILKWGSLLVILREVFSLLGFVVRNVTKLIGVFSGILKFLSTVTQQASIAMGKLAATTQAFAGAAELASVASTLLGASSKGFGAGANLAGKAADAASKKFVVLTGGAKLFAKIIKPLFGVLVKLSLTFLKWGGIIGLIAAAVLALGGIVASVVKTFLSLIGIDMSQFGSSIKGVLDSIKTNLVGFAQFMATIPQRIFLSMQLLTNNITIGVLSLLKTVGLFAGKLEDTIEDLKNESIKLRAELDALSKEKDTDSGAVSTGRDFSESKEFLKARREADNARIASFNEEEGILRRISFVSKKRNQIAQDLQNIISPEIAKQKEILKLEREKEKLLVVARRSSPEGVAREDARIFRARLVNLKKEAKANDTLRREGNLQRDNAKAFNQLTIRRAAITQEIIQAKARIKKFDDIQLVKNKKFKEFSAQILVIEGQIASVGKSTAAQKEEVARLRLEGLKFEEESRDLEGDKSRLADELVITKEIEVKLVNLQVEAEAVQGKNRVSALRIEKQILDLEQERLDIIINAAKRRAGTDGLGKLEIARLDLESLKLQKQKLELISKEKALKRSIIDELGPLNAQFQQNRIEDIQNLQKELIDAGVSAQEVARVTSEKVRDEQIAIWNRIIDRSNDSLQILKGKLVLYFDSTRDLAKQTAEVMFDVFTSLEDALTETISNIARGLSDIRTGFKDFKDAIINIVISALVQLGVQQIKNFLVQKSGILQSISGLQAEGGAVGVLTSQYAKLSVAKSAAASSGGAGNIGSVGKVGGLIGPTLPNGSFFSNGSGGAAGPLLPNGQFVSGTGGGAGGSFADAAGAAGLGAIGGGLLGSAIGGPQGGQAGAIGGALGAAAGSFFGPAGAIAGGAIGGAIGGLFGRSKSRKRKKRERALKRANAQIETLIESLEDDAINLDNALLQITAKINSNTKEAKTAWDNFRKNIEKQRKAISKELVKLAETIDSRITLLTTNRVIRGTVGELQSLNEELEDLREQFDKLPSAVEGAASKINKLFTESIRVMLEELDQLVKDQVKSFDQGARDDAGVLISITKRADLEIGKLVKQREKLIKDSNKSIKDIENEGIALRQKTIEKDKQERIKELRDRFNESKLNLDNQISTIRIIAKERSIANDKALKELGDQGLAIEAARVAEAARVVQEVSGIQKEIATLREKRTIVLSSRDDAQAERNAFGSIIGGSLTNRNRRRKERDAIEAAIANFNFQLSIIDAELATLAQSLSASTPVSTFAKGGPVTETGLAKVHQGEFVIQEKFASRLTPLLESLNKGQIPNISSRGGGGNSDFSIKVVVGSVDSSGRVREIETIVKNLQKKQLFNVRQMVSR